MDVITATHETILAMIGSTIRTNLATIGSTIRTNATAAEEAAKTVEGLGVLKFRPKQRSEAKARSQDATTTEHTNDHR